MIGCTLQPLLCHPNDWKLSYKPSHCSYPWFGGPTPRGCKIPPYPKPQHPPKSLRAELRPTSCVDSHIVAVCPTVSSPSAQQTDRQTAPVHVAVRVTAHVLHPTVRVLEGVCREKQLCVTRVMNALRRETMLWVAGSYLWGSVVFPSGKGAHRNDVTLSSVQLRMNFWDRNVGTFVMTVSLCDVIMDRDYDNINVDQLKHRWSMIWMGLDFLGGNSTGERLSESKFCWEERENVV